jgi:hypothetical protein
MTPLPTGTDALGKKRRNRGLKAGIVAALAQLLYRPLAHSLSAVRKLSSALAK